jgi:hypothetical protein
MGAMKMLKPLPATQQEAASGGAIAAPNNNRAALIENKRACAQAHPHRRSAPMVTTPTLHIILDEGSGIVWNVPDPHRVRHAIIDLPPAHDLPETFDIIVDHIRAILTVFSEERK